MTRIAIPLSLSILLALAGVAGAQPPDDELVPDAELFSPAEGPWVVKIDFDDRAIADALYQRIDVWTIVHDQGYLEAAVSPEEYRELEAEGLRLEIDAAKTRKLRRLGIPLKMQTAGIPGFPCYRTLEETYATAEAIVAAHPDLATWTDIGDSWEKTQDPQAGWDLFVLKLTQSAVPGPKPVFFAHFAIHAREYATAEVGTRFAEMLVGGYGSDPDVTWLLDSHEIHLVLQANPDGRKQAETGLSWRKNTDNDYCSNTNTRGADLNRNFDFEWGCCGGSSGSQCNTLYRGPLPASEPEIQALQAYAASIFPDQRGPDLSDPAPPDATGVAIDVHAYGELVLWPWGFTFTDSPNATAFATLGRKLAFFNGYSPFKTRDFTAADGDSLDYYYGELGVAGLAYEIGTEFFESCSFFEANILPSNLDSLLFGAKVARTPYLTPAGPEAMDAAAPPLPVAAGDLVTLTATVDDTRFNNSNGTEPTQTIAAAEAFVGVPPWDAGAVPLAMVASDGTFDEGAEAVEATIDTTGLAPGRHTLFVRGLDSAGNEGVVAAAFLYVVDPATSPVIQGLVREAGTLAPLAATVTLGSFVTATDPGTGFYSLQVPAGTYDVTAEAAGYLSQTVPGVVANDLATVQQDFLLVPEVPCTVDVDFDDGSAAGWTNSGASTCSTGSFVVATPTQQSSGGVVTQVGGDHTSGTGNAFFSATNSSAGNADVDGGVCIVESPVYPTAADSEVSIWFFHGQRDQGDDAGDFFLLEISTDGGSNYAPLVSFGDVTTGAAWTEATAGVTAGSDVRFRVQVADGSGPGDIVEGGVDDLLICPTAPACVTDADCDDGAYCNGAETCNAGSCQAGTPVACDDGVACTVDACNETTDACDATPEDGACDNGAFCDGSETCDALAGCQAGTPVACDDGVACTVDACNEATDSCDATPEDGACDNGAFCDGAETCDAVLGCQSGSDPCPGQACDEVGDACVECSVDADCDDGLFCTGVESCAAGSCQAGTPVACDDGVGCTVDSCDEGSDSCASTPNDGLCDDGEFCTGVEICDAVLDCQPGTPVVCDDGIACTVDSCDEVADACDFAPDDAACQDPDFCNGAEVCTPGVGCEAGSDPCPGEVCDEAGDACVECLLDSDCDDALFCNGAETCSAGACQAGGDPCPGLVCDEDADICFATPPTAPNPADGATGVGVDADLSWTAGSGADSHDVYFGTAPTPGAGEFQGNQTGTIFDPGTLAFDTTYYWRVDEVSGSGTTTGPVWSFTTEPDTPPDEVTILKAEWRAGKSELKVEATSSAQPGATLTLVDFGQMTFRKNKYRYQVKPVANPGTVTVVSDQGGSDTVPVVIK